MKKQIVPPGGKLKRSYAPDMERVLEALRQEVRRGLRQTTTLPIRQAK